ncbi:MAG: tRNA (cytidine(34)-2'-O)-methyltransferase [Deltaproteobacteria bacterium]|nr:tRNA (cytidine(34)-2'-O)-methyltransferase [Deltaproteobacteria bacterium]
MFSAQPKRLYESPPVNVVLVEPRIPPNTGNVARLCAASACHLVLVGPMGFELSDAKLKRAGLDYWEYVSWEYHESLAAFLNTVPPSTLHLLSAKASTPYTRIPAAPGDFLVFGSETTGLGANVLKRFPDQCYTVPMAEPRVRSINLSAAVAIVVYDVLRRLRPFELS